MLYFCLKLVLLYVYISTCRRLFVGKTQLIFIKDFSFRFTTRILNSIENYAINKRSQNLTTFYITNSFSDVSIIRLSLTEWCMKERSQHPLPTYISTYFADDFQKLHSCLQTLISAFRI